MAGARARKLDLSGFLSGNANVANLRSSVTGGSMLTGILKGVGGGLETAGNVIQENRIRADQKAERETERSYQRQQDAFRNSLALKADARAAADQAMQEEDHKIKVAANAKGVEETLNLLGRAKASAATGMPMDPKVIEEIQKRAGAIQAAGGPQAIMAEASKQTEPDIESLVAQTAQLEGLHSLITAQMAKEKDPVRHAALGDAFTQLGAIVDVNKYRIRLHEANSKRLQEKAAKDAEDAADIKARLGAIHPIVDPMLKEAGIQATPEDWAGIEAAAKASKGDIAEIAQRRWPQLRGFAQGTAANTKAGIVANNPEADANAEAAGAKSAKRLASRDQWLRDHGYAPQMKTAAEVAAEGKKKGDAETAKAEASYTEKQINDAEQREAQALSVWKSMLVHGDAAAQKKAQEDYIAAFDATELMRSKRPAPPGMKSPEKPTSGNGSILDAPFRAAKAVAASVPLSHDEYRKTLTPELQAKWDALTPEQKDAALKRLGR